MYVRHRMSFQPVDGMSVTFDAVLPRPAFPAQQPARAALAALAATVVVAKLKLQESFK